MADDLRVSILLNVDGKQAVGELKIARAELAGLTAEAKRGGLSSGLKDAGGHARNVAAQMGSLGQGLRGAAYHAKFLTEELSSVSRETAKSQSAASNLAAQFKSIGPAIGVAFAAAAITNFAREVGQAAIQLQKTQATLQFATGSAVEAARGYEFASSEAQRLGLEVASTAQAYAKFTASAKGTAISADEVQTVFTGVIEASRALGLSTSETENAIRALVQMLSKGKITAEEFRGQLGDALPGATRIAAQALGVTTEEFSRMLDEGELTLDFVAKFGHALHKEFGVTATQAAKGLAAETNRLSNAWTEFLQAVGDGGGIDIGIAGIKALTATVEAAGAQLNWMVAVWRVWKSILTGEIFQESTDLTPRQRVMGGAALQRHLLARENPNQVPGAASAVPRQGGETPAILREAELNYAKKGIEQIQARQKAEEEGHKKSLGRVRELAQAHENAWKERAEHENELARMQNQGLDHTEDLIAEESRAWEKLDKQRADAIEEQQRLEREAADERMRLLEREAEDQRRIMLAPFENALEGIQGSFRDAFENIFSGGVDTFKDLAGTIKSVFVRLAAEIAALLVFRPVVSGILGAVGLGGLSSALGLAGATGVGGTGGADILSLIGTGSSVSGAFGGPTFTSAFTPAINAFGASTGLFAGPIPGATNVIGGSALIGGPTSTTGAFGGATLSGTLGAAGLAAVGGGLISGAMGGNTTIGTAAAGALGAAGYLAGGSLAASGAIAGSVVPVIGTIIGAILGGVLGGLFKQTPPRGFTAHEVGVGTIREGGKKGFDPDNFDPLTKAIDKSIVALGKELDINTKGIEYWIGYKEGKGYRTTVRGRGDVDFEDPESLQRTIVLQELQARAGTPFQKHALRRASEQKTLEGVIGSIEGDIQFRKDWNQLLGGFDRESYLRDLREQLKALSDEFSKMRTRAKDLGLSLKGADEAELKARREAIAGQVGMSFAEFRGRWEDLTGTRDRKSDARDLSDQLKVINDEFDKMALLAKELGLSLKDLDEARLKYRRDRLAAQAGTTFAEFRQQWEDLIGKSPARQLRDQLKELNEEFDKMRRVAKALGLDMQGANAAQRRMRRDFLTGAAGGAVDRVRQNLDALGVTDLRSFRDQLRLSPDLAPMEQLAEARRQYEDTKKRARRGDLTAVHELPEAAQRYLDLQRDIYANGPQTAALRDEIERLLDGLIKRLTPAKFNWDDFQAALIDVGNAQIAQLKRDTNRTIDMLDQILRELRKSRKAA